MFVNYKLEDIILEIPIRNSTIIGNKLFGENFITNENYTLDTENIIGYTEFAFDQLEYLDRYISQIKNNIKVTKLLLEEYKFKYSHNSWFIYYCGSDLAPLLVAFDLKYVKDLYSEENIQQNKLKFKQAIDLTSQKVKKQLEIDIKEYLVSNNLDTTDEVELLMQNIEETVRNVNTNYSTPFDLITKAWPQLFEPNPFIYV